MPNETPEEDREANQNPQQTSPKSSSETPKNPTNTLTYSVSIANMQPFNIDGESASVEFNKHTAAHLIRPLIGLGLLNKHHIKSGDFQFTFAINEKRNPVFTLGNKNPLSFEASNSCTNSKTDWNAVWQKFKQFLVETCKQELTEVIKETTYHLEKLGFNCEITEYQMVNSFDDNQALDTIVPEVEIKATSANGKIVITHFPRSNRTRIETTNEKEEIFEAYNSEITKEWPALVEGWDKILSNAQKNIEAIQEFIAEETQKTRKKLDSLFKQKNALQTWKNTLSTRTKHLAGTLKSLKGKKAKKTTDN